MVLLVQYMLAELAVIYDEQITVPHSGVYDEDTAEAVKDFQARHGLPETGEVDRATWDAIASTFNRTFGGIMEQ